MKTYTLKTLLSLTLVVAIAAATLANLARTTPIQNIQQILTSKRSDVKKLEFLQDYFSLGDSYSDVLSQLQESEPGGIGGGPLQLDIGFNRCDLVLSFNTDNELVRIGYYVRAPESNSPVFIELASAL